MDKAKKLSFILGFLGLYLLSAGISWAAFSYFGTSGGDVIKFGSGELDEIRSKINLDLPRTQECPVNGGMFTEIEESIWKERWPLTVIIENHEESRPLEGLHKADVVYEAVAEGGITRFLGVYYCGASAEDVRLAPVRSARVYYINWAAEYGESPIFVHVGGANNFCNTCPNGVKPAGYVAKEVDAAALIQKLGWRYRGGNDFDTHYDIGFPVLFRDPERLGHPIATEHTMVSSTDAIFSEAADRGFAGEGWLDTFTSWEFEDGSSSSSPEADSISFEFWSNKPNYDVKWEYDKDSNQYLRFNGGEKQSDLGSGEQFSAKNVVIQFVKERGSVDQEKHMFYKNIGEGSAIVFKNGNVIEGTWEKDAIDERTIFFDENGDEVKFVRGPIWVEAVPAGNEIEYN
jgi:hypothetical protein